MQFDRNQLSTAVGTALSLGAVAALGATGAAHAQDQSSQSNPQTLQTVVVTGSHIRRVDLETASPVIAVSAQEIQATGKVTLGDVVQNLPAVSGGALTAEVNNHNAPGAVPAGRSLIGLRGLGSSRTLILVDGQRVLNSDMNAIPAAAVERIEVLTDGASSVYGSDAIGGVVNVILKSNYQGAEFSLNYGISDHDDGVRRGASFMFGQTSDKGSLLAGVSYNKLDIILQGNRKFSENALSLTADSPNGPIYAVVGGSSSGEYGNITVPEDVAQAFGCASGTKLALNHEVYGSGSSPTGINDYHCFGNADRYNYASVQALRVPQERVNTFFKGTYHLSDNVDAYLTGYMNKSTAALQLAPGFVGANANQPISADSYYNPFGIDFTGINGNRLSARNVTGGNRYFANTMLTAQVNAGLRGFVSILERDWTWDVGMDYGHYSVSNTASSPNPALLAEGKGPSFLNSDGVVQCGTPSAPIALDSCLPWDPFNLKAPSTQKAMAQSLSSTLTQIWKIERTYHADITGGLFDLPGGTMQLAAGVAYRERYTNNTIPAQQRIDPLTGSCAGGGCLASLQGGYNVKEAYAELFLPLLKDLPFARSFNVTLGDRYSKYNLVGSTNNWKVAFEWRPIDDLLLRGTVATVFRAPTIKDVFATPAGSTSSLSSDPCDHATTPNPACVGVPLDGSFVNETVALHQQGSGLFTGAAYLNFPIKPESGKSFDFGAVYSPHFVPGLSVSVDLWRIYLNNTITIPGEQTVLDMCYNGVAAYCPLIHRYGPEAGGSVGQLYQVFLPTTNLGRLDVKGTDLDVTYRLPEFGWGQFTLGLNATYMTQFKIQIAPGTPANRVLNGAGMMGSLGSGLQSACPFNSSGICFFPRVRSQLNAAWQLGPWNATWRLRALGPFKVGSKDPSQQASYYPGRVGVVRHYGTYMYSDVTVGYNIEPINTQLTLGVDNLFDKQPPMLYGNNSLNANTDTTDFDVVGRYYWGRVTVKF